ncbi:MAG TPA: SBBP repeat-containing protein [Blastocatellia bacterium]|nr:SBBP repeat-containing protein [Blastocatellia bacterium]
MKKLNHLVVISAAGLLLATLLMNWEKLLSYSVSASQIFSSFGAGASRPAAASEGLNQAKINDAYGRLPMSFELNQGQGDSNVRYLARGRGYQVFLTETEAVLRLQNANQKSRSDAINSPFGDRTDSLSVAQRQPTGDLRIKLDGASPASRIIGLDLLPGKSNYLIGADPGKWHKDIPNYARVEYRDVYPGVNLAYYGSQRALEYDFIVSPGSDFSVITVSFEGVQQVELGSNGDLALHLNGEIIYQRTPVIYQQAGGGRRAVTGRYVLKGEKQVGFEVDGYDSSKPLVIDPVLEYSSYLGGGGDDTGQGVKVDSAGSAYVVGVTSASDFTARSAAQPVSKGGTDAFITKLSPSGDAIIYSTYLGGGGDDSANGIAVDSSGSAYVTGNTTSSDFNTRTPLQTSNRGGSEAFIAKLSPNGSQLVYSTYLGSSGEDVGYAIAVDSGGAAYVTGYTTANDFNTQGPLQSTNRGGFEAFVAKLNPAGSALTYSTYLGGAGGDLGSGIAVDGSGNAYVIGYTTSTDFNTKAPALQSANGGGLDLFITKLNPAGSDLVYSTYLGGADDDQGFGVAVDAARNVYLSGTTASSNFPVTNNPIQSTRKGTSDAFVTKINPAGAQLVYSTYLGGGDTDTGRGIAVDATGSCYIAGDTTSTDFPVKTPLQSANRGGSDAFVVKLSASGASSVFATYLGGSRLETGYGIAIDAEGNVYVTGSTASLDFEVNNAAQGNNLGGADAFVTKISSDGAQLSYSTYLGGSGADSGLSIAVDSSGATYLTGSTAAANFEVKNPAQSANRGGSDVFVAKINSNGSALLYATYLGGSGLDQGQDIAVDQSGAAYLTGVTSSTDFNIRQPLQATNRGGGDAFIAKLNSTGSDLIYSTYYGGGGNDAGNSIAVDGSGAAYITGITASTNLTVQTPLQSVNRGQEDAFIVKINAAGSAVVYATYLGGGRSDAGAAIAVDTSGAAYVTGVTASTDFNIRNALQATNRGELDAFVAKISGDGSALNYSSYLGGSSSEFGNGIAVDGSGAAYIVGSTASTDFNTSSSPFQNANRGGFDAFITKINPSGSAAIYSSYLGGSDSDVASSVAVDAAGVAYLTGNTTSTNFPLKSQAQATNRGSSDAFITTINTANSGSSGLVYSTYLGGGGADEGMGIAVGGAGNIYVAGQTASFDLPIANPLQPASSGGLDIFIAKFSEGGGAGVVASVSAASFQGAELSPEQIVAAFGANLATSTQFGADTDPNTPGVQLPTQLAGTTVSVLDSRGASRLAPLFFVSGGQINYLMPLGTALGTTTVTVTSGAGSLSIGNVTISNIAPGIFTANSTGRGLAAAVVLRVKPDNTQIAEQMVRFDATLNDFVPIPIDLGPQGDLVFLILFGTGWRGANGAPNNGATIKGVNAPLQFLGAQGFLVGLDQANVFIPRSLAGSGDVELVLTAAGKNANPVRLNIK